MSCQHPNCSHSIHSTCTNHCHWSLCQEHFNEHKQLLLTEFEQILEDLIQPTNELAKSLEEMKTNSMKDQQKELDYLRILHEKQLNQIEEQSIGINQLQNQFNKISEHLIKIRTNEQILSQIDFQQMDNLAKEINQYQNYLNNSTKDEHRKPPPSPPPMSTYCPLTSVNNYGLLSSHHVPVCSAYRRPRNLYEHLRNYHHLTDHYANELMQALRLNLDPLQTKIFPPNEKISMVGERHPCPLKNASEESGIRCTPCTSMITDKFLPIHLKIVHRLRLPQIKELIQSK